MNAVYQFLSGAILMGAWATGVFFLRFWRRSGERLFFVFGIAFWILALERVVLAYVADPRAEDYAYVYLFRLVAFVLILWAIIDKNRSARRDRRGVTPSGPA